MNLIKAFYVLYAARSIICDIIGLHNSLKFQKRTSIKDVFFWLKYMDTFKDLMDIGEIKRKNI